MEISQNFVAFSECMNFNTKKDVCNRSLTYQPALSGTLDNQFLKKNVANHLKIRKNEVIGFD